MGGGGNRVVLLEKVHTPGVFITDLIVYTPQKKGNFHEIYIFPLLFTKAETTLHGQVRRDALHVYRPSDSPSIAPCTAQYTGFYY